MTEVESAIQFIDSTDRTTWVQVGFGLKSEFGESAWELFDRWSSTASNYNAEVARSQWKSFKQDKGVTIKTVFHLARQAGWQPDKKYIPPTPEQLELRRIEAELRLSEEGKLIAQAQAKAASKAKWILSNTILEKHSYLDAHGMKDDLGLVWYPNPETNLLVIPMRIGKEIVGVQLIDRDGNKKFLKDQRCDMAEFVIDGKGIDIWVEGYMTAMAVSKCVAALKMRARIHATFSAGNMLKIANGGFTIADHDKSGTGERIAKEIGLPYYLPTQVGWDFCDLYVANGLFKSSQILRSYMMKK